MNLEQTIDKIYLNTRNRESTFIKNIIEEVVFDKTYIYVITTGNFPGEYLVYVSFFIGEEFRITITEDIMSIISNPYEIYKYTFPSLEREIIFKEDEITN